MNDAEQPDDQQQTASAPSGGETIIKVVFSGPIPGEHAGAYGGAVTEDVAALRERVAILERDIADALARLESLSRSFATAVAAAPSARYPAPVAVAVGAGTSVAPPSAARLTAALAGSVSATTLPRSDRIPLAVAPSPPPERELDPEPQPDAGEPGLPTPKARGLRRMITVLKHD